MLELIEVQIERFTINLTKKRTSRWHISGPWPTKEYLLEPPDHQRFATTGDTIECVILERSKWNYNGVKYENSQVRTDQIIVL